MLQIHRLPVKSVKKFVVFNLCLLLSIITLCNIFTLNCFADESDATSSATDPTSQSELISTDSITEPTELPTEASSEQSSLDADSYLSASDVRLYFFIIIIILLIITILCVLRMVI